LPPRSGAPETSAEQKQPAAHAARSREVGVAWVQGGAGSVPEFWFIGPPTRGSEPFSSILIDSQDAFRGRAR
jgi:hypothetical protein